MHRRRRFQRPGPPELLAVLLLVVAVASGVLWSSGASRDAWRTTGGLVTHAAVRSAHYNATDLQPHVELTYEYTVSGRRFIGQWAGIWPSINSPNALPPGQLLDLEKNGYPLAVQYDPRSPDRSRIHGGNFGPTRLYGVVCIASILLAAYYSLGVYPRWKFRQAYRLARA